MASSSLRTPIVLLTGACVVLATVLVLELANGRPSLDTAPVVAPKAIHDEAVSTPARFSMPPLNAFREIADRPLFSRSRRPVAPVDREVADVERSSALVLNGIILTKADKIALLAVPTSDRMTPLREGDALAGWTLVTVYPEKVVIRSGDTEQEVFLSDTLKMDDSAARRRARQLQAQQLQAQQVRAQQLLQQQQPRPHALQQPAVEEKAVEQPASSSNADRLKVLERLAEQQQNQEQEPQRNESAGTRR